MYWQVFIAQSAAGFEYDSHDSLSVIQCHPWSNVGLPHILLAPSALIPMQDGRAPRFVLSKAYEGLSDGLFRIKNRAPAAIQV